MLASAAILSIAGRQRARAEAAQERGLAALAGAVTVDMHSHAGGFNGIRRLNDNAPYLPLAAPMRAGGMAVACLAIVPDAPAHKVLADERIHPFRTPEPGELYVFSARAFGRLMGLVREQSLAVIADAAALRAARSTRPSAIISSEGGDFMEGVLDRLDEAYAKYTLRHLQLTHYRVNELGDIQTEAPVFGGLSPFGADVLRRCNALGVVVDIAHGTYDLVRQAAAITTKPLVLSHTSLVANPGPRSRRISPDHARVVAQTGGVIGVWPPTSVFVDKAAMAAGIARLADVVGVDHVGIGTDMMGLISGSCYGDYAQTPEVAAALLDRGFSAADVRRIMGGNYVRVFEATLSSARVSRP